MLSRNTKVVCKKKLRMRLSRGNAFDHHVVSLDVDVLIDRSMYTHGGKMLEPVHLFMLSLFHSVHVIRAPSIPRSPSTDRHPHPVYDDDLLCFVSLGINRKKVKRALP